MIYVDEPTQHSSGLWSHLWSDPADDRALDRFAARLGVKRIYAQVSNGQFGRFYHYDLRPRRRLLAIKYGAKPKVLREWITEKLEALGITFTPKINCYTCRDCGGVITTIERLEGTTPMMINCRAKFPVFCPGTMFSSMYQVDQTLEPTHEWYKPDAGEYKKLNHDMRQHIDMGGLLLKRIGG